MRILFLNEILILFFSKICLCLPNFPFTGGLAPPPHPSLFPLGSFRRLCHLWLLLLSPGPSSSRVFPFHLFALFHRLRKSIVIPHGPILASPSWLHHWLSRLRLPRSQIFFWRIAGSYVIIEIFFHFLDRLLSKFFWKYSFYPFLNLVSSDFSTLLTFLNSFQPLFRTSTPCTFWASRLTIATNKWQPNCTFRHKLLSDSTVHGQIAGPHFLWRKRRMTGRRKRGWVDWKTLDFIFF